MNRLPESVNHQFSQLFAVIGQAGDDLKIASAEASLSGDLTAVVEKIYDCKRLQILEMEVKACLKRFEENRANKTQVESYPALKRKPSRTSGRAKLRVKLGDKIIE